MFWALLFCMDPHVVFTASRIYIVHFCESASWIIRNKDRAWYVATHHLHTKNHIWIRQMDNIHRRPKLLKTHSTVSQAYTPELPSGIWRVDSNVRFKQWHRWPWQPHSTRPSLSFHQPPADEGSPWSEPRRARTQPAYKSRPRRNRAAPQWGGISCSLLQLRRSVPWLRQPWLTRRSPSEVPRRRRRSTLKFVSRCLPPRSAATDSMSLFLN